MSGKTKISWATHTWNVTAGCSKVSAGCANCYAERIMWRLAQNPNVGMAKGAFRDTVDAGPPARWTGEVVMLHEELSKPMHWKKPRRIFVNSMSDLFHERVPDDFIAAVFGVMAACPQHTFMVLTKRPRRMREWLSSGASRRAFDWVLEHPADCGEYLNNHEWDWPLHNVMLGVSVEDQATADERIPKLLATPAAKRFVSYEPAIGPVDLAATGALGCDCPDVELDDGTIEERCSGTCRFYRLRIENRRFDWVIMGCESGPHARPMNPDWARSVRDQCAAAQVPFFFKQMSVAGKLVKMPELDGVVHDAMPEVKR